MSTRPPIELPGYELLQEIGSGGMATVFLAVQKSLDRKVAIKILRTSPNEADPERTEKRFLREGKTLAKISHKNVCGIYDIARVGNVAYIAMEYLEGGTLVEHLREGITAGEAIAIVVQVAAALSEAHAQGIVHRDLKPANVMMRGGKVPVLTDFGIARELTADQTKITAENMIVGTPIYMSPEQVSGGEVDGRSDLYSLGIMFYELLTGQPPYQGDTPIAVCMQHLTAPVPQLSGDLAELNPILEKLLAKKREDRYDDLHDFTRALRDVFVHSDAFREVLQFNPNTPWSDQLRELGFSFDTLRDAELRAAVGRQDPKAAGRTTAKSKVVPAKTPPKPKREPAEPRPRPPWLIPAAAAALLLIVVLVGWLFLREEKLTDVQLTQLRSLSSSFKRHLDSGELTQPQNENALAMLNAMYGVSNRHSIVVETERQFREALFKQFDEMIVARQFGGARSLLMAAGDVLGDELESRLATLDQSEQAAGREERIVLLVAELSEIRAKSGWVTEPRLAEALEELRNEAGIEESRYKAQVAEIGKILDAALSKAVDSKDIAEARNIRERIDALLPGTSYAAEASKRMSMLAAQVQAQQTRRDLDSLLKSASLGVEGLNDALLKLDSLRTAGVAASELSGPEQLLIGKVASEARDAVRAKDLMQARALIDPSLQRFPNVPALIAIADELQKAQELITSQQRAEEEKQKAGRLALDATPWAQVVSVTAANGGTVSLESNRNTPFLLTVPEGDYTIVMQGPDGKTRLQESATVVRGQDTVSNLQFATIDADAYLREAGYR